MFPKLAAAVLVIAFAVFLQRRRRVLPFAAVLLLTSIFFSRIYWRTGGFTLRFESLACLLLFLTYAYDLWKNRVKPSLDAKTALVLALFPAMIIPSVFVSPAPRLSLMKTLIYVPYLLAFLALIHFLRKKGGLAAAWDCFYAAGVLALGISVAGLVLFMAGIDLGMIRMALGTLWLRGTFVIPNILGSTTVLILVAGFLRLVSPGPGARPRAPLPLLGLVLSSISVLTCMTVSAWVGAGLGFVGAFLYGFWRADRKKAFLGLAVVGLTVIATYAVTSNIAARVKPVPPGRSLGEFGEPSLDIYWKPTPLYNRFNYWAKTKPVVIREQVPVPQKQPGGTVKPAPKTILRIIPSGFSLNNRRTTASEALKDWTSSPIIGRGTESFAIIRNKSPLSYISSTWVSILHDWGLVGLSLHLAVLALIFLGLARAFRRAPDAALKARAFAFLLVFGLSTAMYQSATTIQISIFWVLLALFVVASSPREEGPEASAPAPAKL